MTEPGHDRLAAAEQARELAERRAADARNDARQLAAQNAKLQETLRQARDRLATFRQQVEAMSQPPLTFATVVGPVVEDAVDVAVGGRRLRVALDPSVQAAALAPGSRVLLNESSVLVSAAPRDDVGDIAAIREILPDGRHVIVDAQGGTEQVVALVPALVRDQVKAGDSVLVERAGALAFAKVRREGVEDLVLEEIPDLDYDQIGGLTRQIEQVRDAVELPFLHRELYARYGLQAPKGVLLYGPPGCGKTMIAKAVAHSLATSLAEQSGGRARSYFLNIKGPELLNKYVGETERQIRTIFQRARERASAGMPVIVFFDEMESLFRTRGSGVSSDVESTVVPQLLSEIDGVEGLANVIIIGASNREDLIDPAILRPGRLDLKIKLDRPDAAAAREIFAKYLTPALPLLDSDVAAHGGDREATVRAMIDATVTSLYATSPENRFLEVTYAGGDREVMYVKDFASGAMINNIVGRAKRLAIKAELGGGPAGVSTALLLQACRDEFAQNEDLPNTTDPDDWARISGKKGERIVFIRTLVGDGAGRSSDASA